MPTYLTQTTGLRDRCEKKLKMTAFPNATNVPCCNIDCPTSYPILFTVYNNSYNRFCNSSYTGIAASFDYMYCLYISDSINCFMKL